MFGVSTSEGRTPTSHQVVTTIHHSGMEMGDHISRLHHRPTPHKEATWLNYGGSKQID